MPRPPRSHDAKTKAKAKIKAAETKAKIKAGSDLKQRKKKLAILRTFLLFALTVTSVASPSAGLVATASIGAFDETHAPRASASPRRPSSPGRPSADELKAFAAELVEKRLGKLKTTDEGKAMLEGRDAQDAVNAVISLFFARLEEDCARNVFRMMKSAESFETLQGHLFLTPEAAKRATEAYTKKTLGVYYYEVPFFKPDFNIVRFYETYASEHIKCDTTKFGPSFIKKCRMKWNDGLAAMVRYVGKRASATATVIERGVDHFYDGRDTSGARFFHPAAIRVPMLYDECDAESRDARGVTAALLLDDHDVRELAETLGMTPKLACVFAETVMMALLRTRCYDEDGGCGTNIHDGFAATRRSAGGAGARRTNGALIDRVVAKLTSNTGWMTYKDIADAIDARHDAVRKLVKSKDHRSKFVSKFKFEKRSGRGNPILTRLLKSGEAPAAPAAPRRRNGRLMIDHVVAKLTSNTGWMTFRDIADAIDAHPATVRKLVTSKDHRSKFVFEIEKRSGRGTTIFKRLT